MAGYVVNFDKMDLFVYIGVTHTALINVGYKKLIHKLSNYGVKKAFCVKHRIISIFKCHETCNFSEVVHNLCSLHLRIRISRLVTDFEPYH